MRVQESLALLEKGILKDLQKTFFRTGRMDDGIKADEHGEFSSLGIKPIRTAQIVLQNACGVSHGSG
jgi:hypothetical protein